MIVDHIGIVVRDLLRSAGLQTTSDAPYPGAEGNDVFFLHPKETHSVLCEFCEK